LRLVLALTISMFRVFNKIATIPQLFPIEFLFYFLVYEFYGGKMVDTMLNVQLLIRMYDSGHMGVGLWRALGL